MAIFAMGDLHLPISVPKPMDIFGRGWDNYVEKIEYRWNELVAPDDVVILCGDTSWATYMEDAKEDFLFIQQLNGTKLISKGNHDYWWTTASKLQKKMDEWGFDSIHFLHNSAYLYQNVAICATRGYALDEKSTEHDRKIYDRELIRMGLSVDAGKAMQPEHLILALHYPPDEFYRKHIKEELGIDVCVFGHLHGDAARQYQAEFGFHLVSSDFLDFTPKKIWT